MGFCPDAAASRQLTEMRSLLHFILACLAFTSPASALNSLNVETLCELVATAGALSGTLLALSIRRMTRSAAKLCAKGVVDRIRPLTSRLMTRA